MNFKKIFNKTNSGLTVIIIIGIIAVVNFLSYQVFYRWDLTQNKDYSISKISKKTIKNLDDVVNIKAYFSKNLPNQYITLQQEVGDILDEYQNYSNGKIRVEFVNPENLEERDLYMLGIPTLQFNVLEKDKYQIVKGHLGMVIQYGDAKETIPVIQSTENLEYQITMNIKKLTIDEMAVIGLLSSHDSLDTEKEISAAYKKLSELYEIENIDLEKTKQISSNIKTLLIIGPKEKFTEEQLKTIDAFVIKGGALLVLVDGMIVGEGMTANKNDTGLNDLLKNYGIKLDNNLVLDKSSGMASFSAGFFTFTTNYPMWPKIIKQGFDQNNAAVANLESLVLPWPSSVEILSDKIDQDTSVSYLAQTTEHGWLQTENYNLDPQQDFFTNNKTEHYNLAVAVSGKFNSPYDQGSTEAGRIIVVGDSDFASDRFLRQYPDNLVFFQNLVDSLSLDEDLINIRSKGVSGRPIKELSETQKATARYLNVFGVTILVVVFGMARYFMRRRKNYV